MRGFDSRVDAASTNALAGSQLTRQIDTPPRRQAFSMRLAFFAIAFAASIGLVHERSRAATPQRFELNKSDHVCLIGNALAERMQHFGWLETYVNLRYPSH